MDVSKLRINVAELNAEISKRYEALGEYVYETCREQLAEDAEAVGKMAELDELVNQRNAVTRNWWISRTRLCAPPVANRALLPLCTAATAAQKLTGEE